MHQVISSNNAPISHFWANKKECFISISWCGIGEFETENLLRYYQDWSRVFKNTLNAPQNMDMSKILSHIEKLELGFESGNIFDDSGRIIAPKMVSEARRSYMVVAEWVGEMPYVVGGISPIRVNKKLKYVGGVDTLGTRGIRVTGIYRVDGQRLLKDFLAHNMKDMT